MSLCNNKELVAAEKARVRKALDWLHLQNKQVYPVASVRNGDAQYVGYVFKIDRGEKPSIWYVYDVWKMTIRRFCTY